MPNEFTWSDIFCKNIDKTYSRIASPGDSINGQVYKAFKYFEEIGNPKIIVGLFPLHRLEYFRIPNKFVSPGGTNSQDSASGPSVAYFNNSLLKFSKAPHDPTCVIPKQFPIYYNFMFIKMLEQYCDSHDIKFIWSIYEEDEIDAYIQTNRNDIFKNYFKTSHVVRLPLSKSRQINETRTKELPVRCDHDFANHKLCSYAADFNPATNLGHWGIHVNHHLAELFTNRYNEVKND